MILLDSIMKSAPPSMFTWQCLLQEQRFAGQMAKAAAGGLIKISSRWLRRRLALYEILICEFVQTLRGRGAIIDQMLALL